MSGWPSPDRSGDSRLAEYLAAGDGDALAQLFDLHAARLYDYCHALLRDQEAAALALHDALLATAAHAGVLREPDRFRSWLYAMVRNECLRRLQDGLPTERHEAPEVEDLFLGAEARTRRTETRQLVHSALSGLSGRQREALDLLLRHGLEPEEIGGVLGISAQQAVDLTADARAALDNALAAAMVARDGRDDCPSVAALVDDGQWPLTPAACRKLIRHIDTCPVCTERRRHRLSTPGMLQALPVALLPANLRGRVLHAATDPDWAVARDEIAQRTDAFDAWGWPVPVEQPARGAAAKDGGPPKLLPVVVAAIVVVMLVTAAFMFLPGSESEPTAGSTQRTTTAPAPSDPSSADPTSPSEEPSEPTESPSEPTPTITTRSASPSASSSPSPRRSTPLPRTNPSKPRPKPTKSRQISGRLSVGGCQATAGGSCEITVSAVGGPVSWSVTGTSGGVQAGGSGNLSSGESATVTAGVPSSCGGDDSGSGSVSFSPNGSAAVSWQCPQN